MVGCWRCTYPSIHFFRLKITVGCRLCTYPSKHSRRNSFKNTVGCLVCGVVWCVVVVCGEAWHTLFLSFSPSSFLLSLLPLISLLTFFFLSSFSFSFSFALTLALALALALVLYLSLLSSFFPSTHSSLLFRSRQQTLHEALINKHGGQLRGI